MSNEFNCKDGQQNIAQGDNAIGKQENVTQEVSGDSNIFSGTGNVTVNGIPPALFAEYAGKLAVTESTLRNVLKKQQVPLSDLDSKLFRINLGISCANQRFTRELDLQGVLVLSVEPGSSAAKAGIRGTRQVRDGIILGDIISGVNTVQIQDFNQFQHEIEKHKVGETVTVTLLREGSPVDVEVTIEVALKDI